MNGLLVDIGNSRFKGCITRNGKAGSIISSIYRKEKKAKEFGRFIRLFRNDDIGFAYISNNDKSIVSEIKLALKSEFGKIRIVFVNKNTRIPLKIDYSSSLGSDRICSAAGAYIKYGNHKNILIIDFGTATTVNLITGGIYKGGMISAGLKTSADTLFIKTTLPEISFTKKASLINSETEKAIISGLLYQQAFFAERTISELKKSYRNLFVVLTGGGIKFLKPYVKTADIFDENLVTDGLNIIAAYNENIRKKK